MGQILKFPGQASKLGYTRVKKRKQPAENPDQLHLFAQPSAQILQFVPELSRLEHDFIADAYCNLGIIESQKGSTIKAFDCFTTSLKHDPRHSEAHYNLANLYFDLNDFSLAQVHYEMAGEVDPAFANVYFNLALVQAIKNDLDAAISALTTYQELVSQDEARNADDLLNNLKKSLAAVPRKKAEG